MAKSTKSLLDIETGAVLEEESFEYSGPLALCDSGAIEAGKKEWTQ